MNQQDLLKSGRLLPVMEEFYSLQGEGFHTGEAAWFIRIGGCDVGCTWCDIKESWNANLFPPVETDRVVEKALECRANAVIVTGGEPLLYNLDYLCDKLKGRGSRVEGRDNLYKVYEIPNPKSQAPNPKSKLKPLSRITDHGSRIADTSSTFDPRPSTLIKTFLETSGSQPLSGIWDWICLSPKRDWPPRAEFYKISHELKVIIQEEEDFKWAEEQAGAMNDDTHLFLQPEWSRREEMLPKIIQYIESHPVWRLSLQAHKYIGIP